MGVETKNTKIEPFDVPDELADAIFQGEILVDPEERAEPMSKETRSNKQSQRRRAKLDKMMEDLAADDEDDEIAALDDEELTLDEESS